MSQTLSADRSAQSSLADARLRSQRLETAFRSHPTGYRVLTGDRPTGPLHLGHYFGTLLNRVRLQDLGVETMVLVADYQTITDRDSPASLPSDVEELVADYLAVGIDPSRSTVFAHSQVPELNQLIVPFLSLVSVPELARNPTVKEEQTAAGLPSASGLLFTYPVHQAADILFCHGNVVPVGKDQLPHLELTRLIARRFNQRYSRSGPYFPEPEALLSEVPILLGTDAQKMSKSRGNAIAIGASADETARLLTGARTDSTRRITYEPVARPAVSNLVLLAALCLERDPHDLANEIGDGGAAGLKRVVTEAVNERLGATRARRNALIEDRGYLRQVLRDGTDTARAVAVKTLATVQELMHTAYSCRQV
jgi:tryptophanyl-tRNA synthetase